MKKIYRFSFGVCGIVFLILTGCRQETLPISGGQEDYISFKTPVLDVQTDTRSTTKNALEVGDQFGVLGYCVPYLLGTTNLNYNSATSFWGIKYYLCPPSVFYNTPVTVGNGVCSYDSPKMWYREGYGLDGKSNSSVGADAEQYRYTFFAYYPYKETDPVFTLDTPEDASVAGAPKFTFTMPQEGDNIEKELDYTNTPDAMFGVLQNQQKSQGSLTFTFSHLLTALGFEVNNFSERELKVHRVALKGTFHKQIVLDFSKTGSLDNVTFPNTTYTGTYILYDEADHNNEPLILSAPQEGMNRTTTGLLPKGDDGEGEHILLVSGRDPYLGTNVRVYIDYTFGDDPKVTDLEGIGSPMTFHPTPGTKYTAQLNFVGNAFVLQFIVDKNEMWEDGKSDDSDIIFE